MTPETNLNLIDLKRRDESRQLFLHAVVTFPFTTFIKTGEPISSFVEEEMTREVTVYVSEQPNIPSLRVANPISYLIDLGLISPTNAASLPLRLLVKDAEGRIYADARVAEGGVLQQDEPIFDSKPIKWV